MPNKNVSRETIFTKTDACLEGAIAKLLDLIKLLDIAKPLDNTTVAKMAIYKKEAYP